MTFQDFLNFCRGALDSYRLIGDFLTSEFTIGSETMTIITALSGSLVFLLSATFALHLIHLINPLG